MSSVLVRRRRRGPLTVWLEPDGFSVFVSVGRRLLSVTWAL